MRTRRSLPSASTEARPGMPYSTAKPALATEAATVCASCIGGGGVPVIAALKGAVVGGGLELASSVHIRVMDETTYFGLPEGQRGLFTGGGATIRVPALIGRARMVDMMLTGRLYSGDEAVSVGLAQYRVPDSEAKAYELARACAQNTPLSNFAICSAISHMQNMSGLDAAYAEAMVAGIVNTQDAAKGRLDAFAKGTGVKIKPT